MEPQVASAEAGASDGARRATLRYTRRMSDEKAIGPQADEPMRQDLNAGLRFMHVMEMQSKNELYETSAALYALLEELVARGVVDLRSLEERRARVKVREAERALQNLHVEVSENVDKYALKDLPVIDCEARIPLCKGRCCALSFSLSFQDLDEGVVRWDYSRPYKIRQRPSDGYCVHNDPETRGCGVYLNRPAICRSYDCRKDKRIWVDFENRIPAPTDVVPAGNLTKNVDP
jgi:Fe-S-cluster containining protein